MMIDFPLQECAECGFWYSKTCINCEVEKLGIDPVDYIMLKIAQFLGEEE